MNLPLPKGNVLLTGASGFLGGAIVAHLANEWKAPGDEASGLHRLRFLVRSPNQAAALARLRTHFVRFGVAESICAQLKEEQIVCADMAELAKLIDPATWGNEQPQLENISHVIHSAALATFSNNPAIRPSNVEGTLALAHATLAVNGTLCRWTQIGTAMCCGMGLDSPVSESWLNGLQAEAHLVPYSRSKLDAELALKEISNLNMVAARASVIVGHSELGCTPSPSIFWVFRMAFALERFTCEPHERIDIIPVDWCARAICHLTFKPELRHNLYHVSSGASANQFFELDAAYARAMGVVPIAARYEKVAVEDLRSLVPLFEQRLGKVNRILILRALSLYGAFAQMNYVFDNNRLLKEAFPLAPRFVDYIGKCAQTSVGVPMAEQMSYDFK